MIRFEDISSTYEKEDVQIDHLVPIIEAIHPGMIVRRNVTTGDPFTRISSTGKLYISHKTTDADIVVVDPNNGLIHAHYEISHLGTAHYRRVDELQHEFAQFRKAFKRLLAPDFQEGYIQNGGRISEEFKQALGVPVLYIERTIDKLLPTDDIEIEEFLRSSFNPVAEEPDEEPVSISTPFSSYSALEYSAEVELAITLEVYSSI